MGLGWRRSGSGVGLGWEWSGIRVGGGKDLGMGLEWRWDKGEIVVRVGVGGG